MKEKGGTTAVIATVIAVALVVAGVGAYFMFKGPEGGAPPTGDEGEGEEQLSTVERPTYIPFFGIMEDFNKGNDITSLTSGDLRELNIKIVRTEGEPFVWDNIEPTNGEFDFTITDNAVNEAFDSRVTIIATLWPYALWDQENNEEYKVSGAKDPFRGVIPDYRGKPQDMGAYRYFLGELVERYDGDANFGSYPIDESLKNKIRQNPIIYWEILNEPDVGDDITVARLFEGTLEDYFDLLKNSYEVIKEACENCQVIIAAPAGSIKNYYSNLTSLGARDYFDIYNLHGPIPSINDLEEAVGTLDRPVFDTESGGSNEVDMVKAAISLAADGFSYAGLGMAPDWRAYNAKVVEGPENDEGFFKQCLLFENGSKTPYYHALQTLATKLENFTSVENMGEGRYKFTVENKPVYVLWGTGSPPSEITGTVKITDLSGNEEQKQASQIALSDSPILIEPVE